jgi:aryl sulfotransferase
MSFFHTEQTWWDARNEPNLLLVHYNNLIADLAGEITRIADFLGINVPDRLLTALVQAAGFEAMRRDGDVLMGSGKAIFQDGSNSFFFKGTNQRWRGVFRDDDLALYQWKLTAALSAEGAHWVTEGRTSRTQRTVLQPVTGRQS